METTRHPYEDEQFQSKIARLMIATIAFTAIIMAFGLALISSGSGAFA